MFKRLRNKLILINLGITSVVILIVFSAIYMISTRQVNDRPPKMDMTMMPGDFNEGVEEAFLSAIREERQTMASNLLLTLILSGVAIEVAVAVISYLMAEEAIKPVREAYESQKVFIANASHEIKTPLAAIAANLEAADIKNNRWISNVELETNKLTSLNNELLALARTDLVNNTVAEETDLKTAIDEAVEILTPRMKNLTFTSKISLPKKIKINRGDFIQILNILLDNAIKYSDKKIILTVNEHQLVVKNDGAKIPADKLPHIFERFYQVDKTADGVGLGLSIAKSLADRNDWKLSTESNELTAFILQF